jgi:hypothetical protein
MAKASPDNSQQKPTFKPLSIEQQNAIDLLILGKSDQETADAVGVDRSTIWSWKKENPLFIATLERRRAEVWRQPQERLRSLMSKAVENVAGLVEAGDYDASIELLKITGMYRGLANHIGEQDPEKVFDAIVERRLAAEKIPGHMDDLLIKLDDNPRKAQRKSEIEAELWRKYGEAESL